MPSPVFEPFWPMLRITLSRSTLWVTCPATTPFLAAFSSVQRSTRMWSVR